MQNARRALQANHDIRRMYHDMKNHLLVLREMTTKDDRMEPYLESLLSQFEGYETQVSTGSPVVDALLNEKIQRALFDQIQFNVYLDLSALSFMKPIDLVTIIGNAVDNAIEAVRDLPAKTDRIVYLKSNRTANLNVIQISNQYEGTRSIEDGKLKTGKANPEMHGIGVDSIRTVVKRYGGSVEIKIDDMTKWFRMTIMIPDNPQN